jgi:hypothetical protein
VYYVRIIKCNDNLNEFKNNISQARIYKISPKKKEGNKNEKCKIYLI